MHELKFTTFETPGISNTEDTIKLAKINADILHIQKIVVASTTGTTIQQVCEIFDPHDYEIICVTHSYHFRENVDQEFPQSLKNELKSKGVSFIQGILAFSGVESSLIRQYQHVNPIYLFAKLTRSILGEGIKVAMEMALMGVDSGKIGLKEEIITISGTGRGADTCCLVQAGSSRLLEHLKIKAILAKPC